MPSTANNLPYAQNCFYDIQTLTPKCVMVTLSFLTNGGSSPVNSLVTGKGCASVTRIGGGAYTVVFDANDLPKELVATFWSVTSPSTNSVNACVAGRAYVPNTAAAGATGGTINCQVFTASTGATLDIAAGAGNRIDATLIFQDAASIVPG